MQQGPERTVAHVGVAGAVATHDLVAPRPLLDGRGALGALAEGECKTSTHAGQQAKWSWPAPEGAATYVRRVRAQPQHTPGFVHSAGEDVRAVSAPMERI